MSDLLKCHHCGVLSNQTAVLVQPHDPDPSTWEANPPALCQPCEARKKFNVRW